VGAIEGEYASLKLEERQRVAAWWMEVLGRKPLQLMVHVGDDCLADARQLAAHAEKIGANAIAAVSPCLFKATNVERLVSYCESIAEAAPRVPFYFDYSPGWTGANVSPAEFLGLGRKRIPTLAGLIYNCNNVAQFQSCVCVAEGNLNIIFGCEEMLIAGLALGARASVGGTLTCGAPIYQRLFGAYLEGDIQTARMEQARALELMEILRRYGVSAATKAVMGMIGIDCGPPRQPLGCLSHSQLTSLRSDLERIEFFDWIGPNHERARKPLQRHHAGLAFPQAKAA